MKQIGIVVCLASVLGVYAPQVAAQARDVPGMPQQRNTTASPALVDRQVHCDVEAKCLAKLRGIAGRSGKSLNLKLDDGSTKSFPSTDLCEIAGESCKRTSLVDYRPSQHLFVLSAQYYESSGSIIVSRRTGEIFRIEDASPNFSPDGKRFVVVAVSEQDGINQVAIYSTSAFPPVLEWSHTPKSFSTMYSFVAWNGNDQIKLRTLNQNSEASLNHTPTDWRLTPADN